jgi:hypothetical protein
MSPILTQLLNEIDGFLAARGMSESKFGIEAMGDKHFIRELRRGRDCQASTIDRVREFISAHWVDCNAAPIKAPERPAA